MTAKEISELRRRWTAGKNNVRSIYGCFVNTKKEIVADLDEPLALMGEEEAERYLSLLKKTLSGAQGRSLVDIVFSTEEVCSGAEHGLLMTLRESALENGEARRALYERIISGLDLDANYLILLAADSYDVPKKQKDGARGESEEVFRYFLCGVCPVKELPPQLGYFPGDNEFHYTVSQAVAPAELGFMFPAFDDRAANIYNALYYTRKPSEPHWELVGAVFGTEPPMTANEQRETFEGVLSEALAEECSVEVVRQVNEALMARMEEHKEGGDMEPLALTAGDVGRVLAGSGVSEDRARAFEELCRERMGEGASVLPANVIDTKRFELRTGAATVTVAPSEAYLVEARVIDGRRYLLIPAEEEVEVNGLSVRLLPDGGAEKGA